ncbi:MAG: SEC-C domain-containing protein [Bradymonadia bacterium]
MQLGRNDPCWCGSGKKYKVCHLRSDEERMRAERNLKTVSDWVTYHREAMEKDALGLSPEPDAFAALSELELGDDPLAHDDARQWALYDQYGTGAALLGRLPTEPKDPISARRSQLRTLLLSTFPSLHEVIECKRGRGLRFRDRLTGLERFVRDEALSEQLDPMEVIYGRIIVFEKTGMILPNWRKVPFRKRKAMIAGLLEQMQKADLPQDAATRARWLKANPTALLGALAAAQ